MKEHSLPIESHMVHTFTVHTYNTQAKREEIHSQMNTAPEILAFRNRTHIQCIYILLNLLLIIIMLII